MFEIERKFLVLRPDEVTLSKFDYSKIEQTYLVPEGRVRKRVYKCKTVYTHTIKHAVTDITRIEQEREVTEDEYNKLILTADPRRNTVCKTRYILNCNGMNFELDDFGSEYKHALLEIELSSETETFEIPDFIVVIREVTNEKAYRNSAIALNGFFDR